MSENHSDEARYTSFFTELKPPNHRGSSEIRFRYFGEMGRRKHSAVVLKMKIEIAVFSALLIK